MRSLESSRLYTFVDTAYLHGRDPADVARCLCDGGADLIQLRAKDWPPGSIRAAAVALRQITARHGVLFVINDHPAIARDVDADFCHLGQEDLFDAGTQSKSDLFASGRPRLGLSSHAPDQARRAIAAGADYIAVGPVFATGTKPGRVPVTCEYVRWASAHLTLPWFAIGGISLDTLDEVLTAGARRICVVSAILNAPDVARACLQFRDRLRSVPLD